MLIPDTTQTVVAPASAPGSGAIAVVRLSGPAAFAVAKEFLEPRKAFDAPRPRSAHLLAARENGRLLDRTITLLYPAPGSYTGEDMVEIFCHGSPYIISSLVNLAIKHGAVEARPGEFTFRAFMNGKLDLAQAEAVNDLILSESAAAHRAALTQVEGGVSARIREMKGALVTLLSELEVRLDDSYEETAPLDLPAFRKRTGRLAREIKDLADSFEAGRCLKHGIRAAIAGAPNSGKSSLLNSLAGYGRAIVAPSAGTTRDTIEEKLAIAGFSFIFTDTAGINPRTSDAVEKEGISRTLKALKAADIVLWVQDAARRPGAADRRVREAIAANAQPGTAVIKIFNKSDLPPGRPPSETAGGIKLSCRTGEGVGALKELLGKEPGRLLPAEGSAIITSARHFQALLNAGKELDKLQALKSGKAFPLELAAEHLKGALGELAVILGETAPEEILENIFRNFCVGK
ncbi:MAG: tRNA uridine-5-carboxymethylaminomethyl(34) synthesis GTPase MnmE [Elusimicrobia bacterium RIFOXYB2_FULL_62_6]|nr:MAG: tRNA uridine-5-carboxymethylaminomethyl(34) synthesis GTPase MnmE [Elusimicrobia bacterium RIFOXYB2_FULL_62_6]